MSVKTKYYFGQIGEYGVLDPELILVDILCVTRSGTVYYAGTPAENLTFVYQDAIGRVLFGNPFVGPPPDLPVSINSLEKVSVKFKT